MPECSRIDDLVTPFVDGELAPADTTAVVAHLAACGACRARVAAERAVKDLLQTRRADLCGVAPAALKARCARLGVGQGASVVPLAAGSRRTGFAAWRSRSTSLALAATLLLAVAGAFVYQATRSSSRVLAAELTLDHEKCFRLNRLLGTQHSASTVEASMASMFDWPMQLPDTATHQDVNLVGSRPCLSGEGKVAHIMYRYHGQPVSLFMLPRERRAPESVQVLGHRARIWSEGDRTFVLVADQDSSGLDEMTAMVRTTVR